MIIGNPAGTASVRRVIGRLNHWRGRKEHLARVATLYSSERSSLFILCAFIAVGAGAGIIAPLVTKRVFDRDLVSGYPAPVSQLLRDCSLLAFALTVISLASVGQLSVATSVGQRIVTRLRNDLFRHLQVLPHSFFLETRVGDIEARLQSDIAGVQGVLTETAGTALSTMVQIVSSVVALFVLSWPTGLVTLLLLPLFVAVTGPIARRRRASLVATQECFASLAEAAQNSLTISGYELARLLGTQKADALAYAHTSARLGYCIRQQNITARIYSTVASTLFGLVPVGIYVVAGLHRPSPLSLGTVAAITALQARVFSPSLSMLQAILEVDMSLILFERIFSYMDLSPVAHLLITAKPPLPALVGNTRVEVNDVTFGYTTLPRNQSQYDGQQNPCKLILRSFSLVAEPGEWIAIGGRSGAGKSTLFGLMAGLYTPQSGGISIGEWPVEAYGRALTPSVVGLVNQNTFLRNASVRDNLTHACRDASDSIIWELLEVTGARQIVKALAEGLDTPLGERGQKLSGGERQRLALTRMLLLNPGVLLLDEATSALDAESEIAVFSEIRALRGDGRITMLISHRSATRALADREISLTSHAPHSTARSHSVTSN